MRLASSALLIPHRCSSALRRSSFRLPRPSLTPFALALANPALTRSTIMERSNSANTPHIWYMARPDGVVVSIAC